MSIIIVQGSFRVDADVRPALLQAVAQVARVTREKAGCLEYAIVGDPVDEERVLITERWASQEALDRHLAQQREAQGRDSRSSMPVPKDREVNIYTVASQVPLG